MLSEVNWENVTQLNYGNNVYNIFLSIFSGFHELVSLKQKKKIKLYNQSSLWMAKDLIIQKKTKIVRQTSKNKKP